MPWSIILSVALVVFLLRLSFIALLEPQHMPAWMQEALRYVPAAAFGAIILPQLVIRNETLIASPLYPRLMAGCVAMALAYWSRSIPITIASGMLSLWLFQWLLR